MAQKYYTRQQPSSVSQDEFLQSREMDRRVNVIKLVLDGEIFKLDRLGKDIHRGTTLDYG